MNRLRTAGQITASSFARNREPSCDRHTPSDSVIPPGVLSIVTSSVVALLAGTTLSTSATAQQTLRQQLVGTWTMTSCDVKAPFCVNGNSNGSLAFGGNGRYTEVILGRDRPKLASTPGPIDRTTVSAEAYKGIGQGTVAQFGTWSVDEANKTLTLRSESTFTRVNEQGCSTLFVKAHCA
jgi:hypothetical protein